MGTEGIQNGYQMEMEKIRNSKGYKKSEKVFPKAQTTSECVLQNAC